MVSHQSVDRKFFLLIWAWTCKPQKDAGIMKALLRMSVCLDENTFDSPCSNEELPACAHAIHPLTAMLAEADPRLQGLNGKVCPAMPKGELGRSC